MMRKRWWLGLVLSVVTAGCTSEPDAPLTPPVIQRATIQSITGPTSSVSGQPVVVTVRYGIGACEEFVGVPRVVAGALVDLEVQKRVTARAGVACPDLLRIVDVPVTLGVFSAGELRVRGLQPFNRTPVEATVTVTP